MTNPELELVKSPKSYRKRIGITRQFFDFVMTNAEALINRICSKNELVYFCSEDKSNDNVELVLNIMGFDMNHVCQACTEVIGVFQLYQSANFSYLYIPQEIDDPSDKHEYPVGTKADGNTPTMLLPLSPQSPLTSPTSQNGGEQSSPSASKIQHSGDAETVVTPNGIQIRIFHGDLVEQDTEAIVIVTNTKLQCVTSPGKAVAAAVGSRHPDDCCNFLKEQGQLKPCQVMHTDAGNLWPNVRFVIHVAQPRIEDLNEPQKQHSLLENFCFNCLQYASTRLKAKSISMPFALTDSSAVMRPVVASAICKALLKYDEQFTDSPDGSTLQEVKIVCLDRVTVIVQMKTFDVFLPKVRNRSLRESEFPDNSPLGSECCVFPGERKHNSKLRHNGTSLNKIDDEDTWWKERINTYYIQLQLKILLADGLEGELIKRHVFTNSALQYSMEGKSLPEKNKHLLDSLLQGDEVMFRNFCEALKLSGQGHIVSSYLSERAPCTRKHSLPRCVSEPALNADSKLLQNWKVRNLSHFQNELIEQIICDCGLVSHLRSLQVFTAHQIAALEAERHETRRNRLMLQWLAKSSEGAHERFCEALTLNKQVHLVRNYLAASSRSILRRDKSASCSTELLNSDNVGAGL